MENLPIGDPGWIRNYGPKPVVSGVRAACSSDNAIVTHTALRVMREGGNAVDAAIAASLVQAAVEPFMTSHAGTVTFLYYEAATGKRYQLDSKGTMPAGIAPFKPIPPIAGSGLGGMAPSAAIPGFMPGLKAMHERFATKPWAWLCEDAIEWAEGGHAVSSFEFGVYLWSLSFFTYFPEGRRFFEPNGFLTPVGHRFRHPDMAETLRRVAKEGPDWMITGGWADAFVAKANDMGWPITKAHMTATPPRWIEPLSFQHFEHEIVSLAPPQIQGVLLRFVMGVLRHLGIRDTAPGSAEQYFYMAHALRCGLWTCGFMGDPTVAPYDIDVLGDEDLMRAMARMIRGLRPSVDLAEHVRLTTLANGALGGHPTRTDTHPKQPTGSCELSIVDEQGNWVQMMNTLQGGGIPGMVIDGIPMCGCHASFDQVSGVFDAKLVEGARIRSCMGNTIVFKDDAPVLSLGSPGNVFCTVPQVLTNVFDFGMSPYEAIAAPRMLPLQEDNSIVIEDRVSSGAIKGLESMGLSVRSAGEHDWHMGSYQMCFRDAKTGELGTCADPRRCGEADGIR